MIFFLPIHCSLCVLFIVLFSSVLRCGSYEVAQEENSFWQDCLITACQSRKYRETKDLDAAYSFKEDTRRRVIASITPETTLDAFQKFFKEDFAYTAITLEPEAKQPEDAKE